MKNKYQILTIYIICTVLISGCWGKKELTDIAFIIAIGLDKAEDGDYIASFQIVNPGNVASAQPGSQGLPVAVYKTKGKDLVSMAKLGSKRVSRRLYFAHTNLVVIGEKLAREGMLDLFDALERDKDFRITTSVVIARNGTAEDLLRTLTPIDKIPANKIIKTILFTEKTIGENINVNVNDVIMGFVSPGREPVINGFSLYGDKNIGNNMANLSFTESPAFLGANGLGYIKDGKLVDWVSGDNAKTVGFIQNKITSTSFQMPWRGKENAIVYSVQSQHTDSKPSFHNGKPSMTVNVKSEGIIAQADVPVDLTDPLVLDELNKQLESTIEKKVLQGIKRGQKDRSDVFVFGEMFYRKYPRMWNKMKSNWNDEGFKDLHVKVKAKVYIRRSELRNKPFLSNMDKN
ncbi:MAG: Ger(x)C family spore germination protein [Heyndrickxia sp.]